MSKSKLSVVSAIAALSLTSLTYAGGLPDNTSPTPIATGSNSGLYLGLEGGLGVTNWKNLTISATPIIYTCKHDNGIVGRVFVGYDINKYLAAEFGYTHFGNTVTFTTDANDGDFFDVKTQALDLLGKIKAPLTDTFNLYAKIGINYLSSKITNINNMPLLYFLPVSEKTNKTLSVTYGIGAEYAITSNIIANAEWLYYRGSAQMDSNFQPYTDTYMVGLRYKFDF